MQNLKKNSPLTEGCQTKSDGVLDSPLTEGCQTKSDGVLDSPLTEGCQSKTDGVLDYPLTERWQTKSDGVLKKYKSLPYNPTLKEKAKQLRKAGILAEVLLWKEIKNKKILGLDFHRQKIISNYIVDFYCPKLHLVIEIDGSSHDFKDKYDATREKYLKNLGLKVIRFEDKEIRKKINCVMNSLYRYCEELLKYTPSRLERDTPLKEGNTPSRLQRATPLKEGNKRKPT